MWNSEAKVQRALGLLPAPWRVFHSVSWQGRRGIRESDGEADFVILHPAHGLIVLEVKGGGIEVDGTNWFSTNNSGRYRIKNPFEQAKASKYALLRALQAENLARTPIVHGVAFPDGSVVEAFGLEGPRAIVLDAADLATPEESLKRLVRHWRAHVRPPLSPDELAHVANILVPSGRIQRLLRDEVADSIEGLVELTNRQLEVLTMSRRMHRLLVTGAAGTGKTILAKERASRLARSGKQTLLVCYNAPLAAALASDLQTVPNLTVSTFHALVLRTLKSCGQSPASPPEDWWETEAANLLVAATESPNCPRFEGLVLDEAQDFAADWLDALTLLLVAPDNDPIIYFADRHQEIYERGFSAPQGWPQIPLDRNCRNTLPIARRVAELFGESNTTMGADGRPPVFHVTRDETTQRRVAQRMAARMIAEEGLLPAQIVILCTQRRTVEWFYGQLADDVPFVAVGEEGVVTETVQRFKGLEADVILLLMSERNDKGEWRRLAYVGMSRARTMLIVIGPASIKNLLGW